MIRNEIFDRGMAVLMAAYPDYPVTPETLKVYQTALNDAGFTDLQFERVVWGHLKTKKWFPKISELIEANKPTVLDLWNHLILAAESGEKPADLDPVVEMALSLLGGWEQFSRTPYAELHRRYKDFKEAVESAASTHIHQEVQQLEHRA